MEKYPVSKETEEYIASSIDNNKFAVAFAGGPFLTVFLFTILNEQKIEFWPAVALTLGIACLFLSMVYSMYRLIVLQKYRAIVLSSLASKRKGEIEISRSAPWLAVAPGFLFFLGYGALTAAFAKIVFW